MKKLALIIIFSLILSGCAPTQHLTSTTPVMTKVDPNSWIKIPAGDFFFGQHDDVVELPDYEIMTTLVTNQQYAEFLNKHIAAGDLMVEGDQVTVYYEGDEFRGVKHEEEIAAGNWPLLTIHEPATHLNYNAGEFTPQPGFENHPVNGMTWFGANAYCKLNDWRLPTEEEWEKAARGTDKRAYPWGYDIERNQANYYNNGDFFEKTLGKQGDTTPVGYFDGSTYPDGYATVDGASAFGLYDMAGNLWQWTGNIYEGIHYRYLRGGSKADFAYNLRVWSRNNSTPDFGSIHFGFRCARDTGTP